MSGRGIGGAAARAWATPAVAGVVALALSGVAVLLEPSGWYRTPVTILAAAAITVTLTRLATRRAFLPTGIGTLVGGWLLLVAYVPAADDGRSWWPSPSALRTARDMAVAAVDHIYATVAPAPVTVELAALIAAAALALFLAADALAVGAGLAATSGLLLMIPWIPPLVLEARIPWAALAGCLALWLLTVALMRRSAGTRWRARAADGPAAGGIVMGATALSIMIALGLAPLATLMPGWGELPRASLPAAWGGGHRLDLEIDLRDSLTSRSSDPFLTYSSSAGRIPVLKATSLARFDGAAWDPEEPTETVGPTGPLWPEPFPGWAADQTQGITIQVGDLLESHVPIPDSPRAVSAPDGWRYSPSTDELLVEDGATIAERQYSVRFATGFHSPESLTAAQGAIDAGDDSAVDAAYLELPAALDQDRVRELASTVTASATDRRAQALALQEYLRSGSFVYDTRVAPSGRDAVSTFLDERRGYCVHFATAMVMMARSLDMPARLAVGYLGGEEAGDGLFVVRGRDTHAWPEIYFPGHGWVRFEPTPAVQTGARPEYAVPEVAPAPTLDDIRDTARPTASPSAATAAQSTSAPSAGASGDADPTPPWAWVVTGAALTLTVAALVVAALRLRARGRRLDPEQAWGTARRAIGGALASPALTPAEARTIDADELAGWDEESLGAWESLTRAVEDHRYARLGSTASPEELADWLATVRTAARRSSRAAPRTER